MKRNVIVISSSNSDSDDFATPIKLKKPPTKRKEYRLRKRRCSVVLEKKHIDPSVVTKALPDKSNDWCEVENHNGLLSPIETNAACLDKNPKQADTTKLVTALSLHEDKTATGGTHGNADANLPANKISDSSSSAPLRADYDDSKAEANMSKEDEDNTSSKNQENMSSKNLENTSSENLKNMSNKNLENMSGKHLENMSGKNLENMAGKNLENESKESKESHINVMSASSSVVDEYTFCQLCGKNITNYSTQRRMAHVNNCCDLADMSNVRETTPTATDVLMRNAAPSNTATSSSDGDRVKCLLCFKNFIQIKRHLVNCCKKHGKDFATVLEATLPLTKKVTDINTMLATSSKETQLLKAQQKLIDIITSEESGIPATPPLEPSKYQNSSNTIWNLAASNTAQIASVLEHDNPPIHSQQPTISHDSLSQQTSTQNEAMEILLEISDKNCHLTDYAQKQTIRHKDVDSNNNNSSNNNELETELEEEDIIYHNKPSESASMNNLKLRNDTIETANTDTNFRSEAASQSATKSLNDGDKTNEFKMEQQKLKEGKKAIKMSDKSSDDVEVIKKPLSKDEKKSCIMKLSKERDHSPNISEISSVEDTTCAPGTPHRNTSEIVSTINDVSATTTPVPNSPPSPNHSALDLFASPADRDDGAELDRSLLNVSPITDTEDKHCGGPHSSSKNAKAPTYTRGVQVDNVKRISRATSTAIQLLNKQIQAEYSQRCQYVDCTPTTHTAASNTDATSTKDVSSDTNDEYWRERVQLFCLNDKYSDVVVVSNDDRKFPAHRIILDMSCPGITDEERCGKICLDISSETVLVLMEFAYFKRPRSITRDIAIELDKVASRYNLENLKEILSNSLDEMVEINFVKSCGDKVKLSLSTQDLELFSQELVSSSQRQSLPSSSGIFRSPVSEISPKKPPIVLLSPINSTKTISIRNSYTSRKSQELGSSHGYLSKSSPTLDEPSFLPEMGNINDMPENVSPTGSPCALNDLSGEHNASSSTINSPTKSLNGVEINELRNSTPTKSPSDHQECHSRTFHASENADSTSKTGLNDEGIEIKTKLDGDSPRSHTDTVSPDDHDSKLDSFMIANEPDFMYNDMDFYNNDSHTRRSSSEGCSPSTDMASPPQQLSKSPQHLSDLPCTQIPPSSPPLLSEEVPKSSQHTDLPCTRHTSSEDDLPCSGIQWSDDARCRATSSSSTSSNSSEEKKSVKATKPPMSLALTSSPKTPQNDKSSTASIYKKTPKFEELQTPEIRERIDKFGLKQLSKNKAILKLQEIHRYTHKKYMKCDSDDKGNLDPHSDEGYEGGTNTNLTHAKREEISKMVQETIRSIPELYHRVLQYTPVDILEIKNKLPKKLGISVLSDVLDKQGVTFTNTTASSSRHGGRLNTRPQNSTVRTE